MKIRNVDGPALFRYKCVLSIVYSRKQALLVLFTLTEQSSGGRHDPRAQRVGLLCPLGKDHGHRVGVEGDRLT